MPKKKNAVTVTHADGRVEVVSPAKFQKRSRRAELRAARRSAHWRALRLLALERAGHRCECCRKESAILEVHHLTYVRLWRERLEDVTVMCQRCHSTEHQWLSRQRRAA
jgi:5-methylcytosine-specific restriction endonuclease McrA